MMKNLLIDLPEDLLVNNILLSKVLPTKKSLGRLRCVCKYLRSLITSPAFIKMHFHHSTASPNHQLNNQLVLANSTPHPDVFYSLKFNDGTSGGDGGSDDHDPCRPEAVKFASPIKNPRIFGSCNGLLCLREGDDDSNIVCLWNPRIFGSCNGLLCLREGDDDSNIVCLWNRLTKEYKELPPPLPLTEIPITKVSKGYGGSITYGFGYDRFIDDYKIIRCENFVGRFNEGTNDGDHIFITEFQVYTLGTNTWRKISPDNNPYKSYFVIPPLPHNKSIVFVSGALHWNMSTSNCWYRVKVSERTEAKIVSFDIEKEVFREIQRPLISKHDHCFSLVIRVLRGCLCVLEYDDNWERYCNVWMMMDYGMKESWTKLFTMVRKEVLQSLDQYSLPAYYRLLRFCKNGEIIIAEYDYLFVYDPLNNKTRRVKFGEMDKFLYQSEIYVESLASLNTGVYKEG